MEGESWILERVDGSNERSRAAGLAFVTGASESAHPLVPFPFMVEEVGGTNGASLSFSALFKDLLSPIVGTSCSLRDWMGESSVDGRKELGVGERGRKAPAGIVGVLSSAPSSSASTS